MLLRPDRGPSLSPSLFLSCPETQTMRPGWKPAPGPDSSLRLFLAQDRLASRWTQKGTPLRSFYLNNGLVVFPPLSSCFFSTLDRSLEPRLWQKCDAVRTLCPLDLVITPASFPGGWDPGHLWCGLTFRKHHDPSLFLFSPHHSEPVYRT